MELPHVLGNQVAPSGELLWLKVGLWGLWWVLVVWGMFSASYKQFCSLAMERRLHEIWASLARMLLWNQCYLSLIPTANPGARRWWHKPFGWFFLFSFLSAPLGKFLWILGFSRETAPKACVCVERGLYFKELAGKSKTCRVGCQAEEPLLRFTLKAVGVNTSYAPGGQSLLYSQAFYR